jgi:hypothetical protein
MIEKSKLSDFQEWRNANADGFTLFDYLRGNLVTEEVESDVIVAVFELLLPRFVEVENMVFLEEEFSENKLSDLSRGRSNKEIEYWMNLLNISSLFESVQKSVIQEMALSIKASWLARLRDTFPNKVFEVNLVEDGEEWLIAFNQKS